MGEKEKIEKELLPLLLEGVELTFKLMEKAAKKVGGTLPSGKLEQMKQHIKGTLKQQLASGLLNTTSGSGQAPSMTPHAKAMANHDKDMTSFDKDMANFDKDMATFDKDMAELDRM